MQRPISDVAFTSSVKAVQERLGSREGYESMEQRGGWQKQVTPELVALLAEIDSFFLGTASSEGRPYIQHRGGPKSFLKPLDERSLAFADFSGNRQYISVGNLEENDQAFIFLMDWPHQTRVKIWGKAEVVEGDSNLLDRVTDPDYGARIERAIVFHVEAWDVNCRQHIEKRFTEEELAPRIEDLRQRIRELEQQLEKAVPNRNTSQLPDTKGTDPILQPI